MTENLTCLVKTIWFYKETSTWPQIVNVGQKLLSGKCPTMDNTELTRTLCFKIQRLNTTMWFEDKDTSGQKVSPKMKERSWNSLIWSTQRHQLPLKGSCPGCPGSWKRTESIIQRRCYPVFPRYTWYMWDKESFFFNIWESRGPSRRIQASS